MGNQKIIEWILRIGVAGEVIGHGDSGLHLSAQSSESRYGILSSAEQTGAHLLLYFYFLVGQKIGESGSSDNASHGKRAVKIDSSAGICGAKSLMAVEIGLESRISRALPVSLAYSARI